MIRFSTAPTSFLAILLLLYVSVSLQVSAQERPHSSVIYKQIDTTRLRMEIYQPSRQDRSEKRPAIIFFFGGGWISGKPDQFRYHASYYAEKGMVTILADYRIASRNKTSPLQSLKDAKSAIRYLRIHADSLGIDPGCIVGAGGSAGGHLAAACYTNESINEDTDSLAVSPRPDVMVLFNPVIDNSRAGYGFSRISQAFPDFSPIHAMGDRFPPTIFFLGTNDKLIPVSTGEAFKKKVEATGSTCELHLFDGQPHGFFNKEEFRAQIIPLIDRFFKHIPCINSVISR